MKKIHFFLTCFILLLCNHAYSGQIFNPYSNRLDLCSSIQESDGSPAATGCQQINVTNGSLTDNGDGTFSLSTSAGNAPVDATYITQTANATLTAEQAIGLLATGYLKGTTSTGVISSQAIPIPIADGGTNNTTAYTSGSVIFSNGTRLTQNNSKFFWDNTNAWFGIGTSTPGDTLDIRRDANTDITQARARLTTAFGTSGLLLYASEGTLAVPTSIVSGDVIGEIRARGYLSNTASYEESSAIEFHADSDTIGGIIPGRIVFYVQSGTGTKEAMRITRNGFTGLDIYTALGTNNPYRLTLGGDTTQTIGMDRNTTVSSAGNTLTLNSGGAVSGGTNLNGGDLMLSSGIPTGNGSSQMIFRTFNANQGSGTQTRIPQNSIVIDNISNTFVSGIIVQKGSTRNFSVDNQGNTNVSGVITASSATPLKLSAFTAGSIPFISGGGILAQNNANLFWDNTQSFLGIGTAAPTGDLDIAKAADVVEYIRATAVNTSATLQLKGTNGGGGIVIATFQATNSNTVNAGSATNIPLIFITNNAEVGRFAANGDMTVGTTGVDLATLGVDGTANQIQFLVQGNTTQTSQLMTLETSTGLDKVTIDNSGATSITGLLTVSNAAIVSGPLTLSRNFDGLVKGYLSPVQKKCVMFENLVAADDNMLIWNAETPLTLRSISCRSSGFTTQPLVTFEDDSRSVVTGTVTCSSTTQTGWTNVPSGGSILSGEALRFDTVNTPSPTTGTQCLVCFGYTLDQP